MDALHYVMYVSIYYGRIFGRVKSNTNRLNSNTYCYHPTIASSHNMGNAFLFFKILIR